MWKKILLIIACMLLLSGCDNTFRQNLAQLINPTTTTTTIAHEVETEDIQVTHPLMDLRAEYVIHFIDVGHGDAILIQNNNVHNPNNIHEPLTSFMLVDCGGPETYHELISYMQEHGVSVLDYLVLTRIERDALGGCDDILKTFTTQKIIYNGRDSGSATFKAFRDAWEDNVRIVERGDNIVFGQDIIRVLFSGLQDATDESQHTLVLKGNFFNYTFLLPGSCDDECEEVLVDNMDVNVDFVRTPHFCSALGSGYDFIAETSPFIAVSSDAEHICKLRWERYSSIKHYDTNIHGNVRILIDSDDGWWIETDTK